MNIIKKMVFPRRNQSFLEKDADRMVLYKESSLVYPKMQHDLGWATRKRHLDFLYNLVALKKSVIIFETGTFEAHGTFAMAAACHENNNGARIFTFDYDGDPIQDETGAVSDQEWAVLRDIRAENLKLIGERFPNCSVEFINGDTRKVLEGEISKIGGWDFWYQDSMHYAEGIRQEWEIMQPYANSEAVVIFDDVSRRNPFSKWFKKAHGREWSYRAFRDFDHKQCIAQKRG